MQYNNLISDWVKPGSSVLDLGCGDGSLLADLTKTRQIHGYGIEKDTNQIISCLEKGINVLQFDLDQGLANFNENSFDLVILKHTLQALHKPDVVVAEMLKVGKKGIVTFPNFSHWYNRWYLFYKGEMPVSKIIPYTWYSTPNLHHCTCRDFEVLCQARGVEIEACLLLTPRNKQISNNNPLRNLLASSVTYLITK